MNWFYLTADGSTIHIFKTLQEAVKYKTPLDKMIMHTIDYTDFTNNLKSIKLIKH